MWWHILSRSFLNRKTRLALATLSVVLGAGLLAALVNLSLDVPQKAGAQLRAYGANILVLPQIPPGAREAYISEKDLAYLEQGEIAQSIASYVPYLYFQAEIAGQRVVVVGTWLDRVKQASAWLRNRFLLISKAA